MKIDVDGIVEDDVTAWKLDEYRYLVKAVHEVNVCKDDKFKHAFNDFWRIQTREAGLSDRIFDTIEWVKQHDDASFGDVLIRLSPNDAVNKSAASKVLATLYSDLPPWDENIRKAIGLPQIDGSKQVRINQAIKLYDYIQEQYAEELVSENGLAALAAFDALAPDHKDVSNVKKIDFLLWEQGRNKD